MDQAAALLLELHKGKYQTGPQDLSIADATRADALRGLGNVLDAATKLADKAVPSVLRIVDHLIK